eukprot:s2428_g1.t1
MASLDSEAAFVDRAQKIGIEKWIIDKFKQKKFATFGKLAFAFPYTPQSADDTPLKTFLAALVEDEAVTKFAMEFNLQYPPHVIKLERKKDILQARLLAKQCEQQEKELHASWPPCLQKALQGKRLLVWKKLLEKFDYDDMGVFDFMVSGVDLVGKHDTPVCYPEKIRPATLTQGDLEATAIWRRRAIVGKRPTVQDPKHVEHLEETAAEELKLGFIEGPFETESEVSAYFGH